MSKNDNKVDELFVVPFGPVILKTVSSLDPGSITARRNPEFKINPYTYNSNSLLTTSTQNT